MANITLGLAWPAALAACPLMAAAMARATAEPVTTAPKTRSVWDTCDRLSVVRTSRASITADTTWPPREGVVDRRS